MRTLAFALASTLTAATTHAAVIGINFTHNGTDPDDVLFGPAAVAGAPGYAIANWNHVLTDWSGSGSNDALFSTGLVSSDGRSIGSTLMGITYAPHTDPIHFDANNTWRSGIGNGSPNDTLMNGYLDDGGNDQPYLNFSIDPAASGPFTVVVYAHGDGANAAVGRYWLEEWTNPLAAGTVITDQVGILSNDYTGTFISAGTFGQTGSPANVDVATGNYLVFSGITAHNIRIRAAGNGDPEDFGRGPLNAVLLIVPEPTRAALLAFGALGLLLRRRR